jgi:hypothetical protein
LKVTRPLSLADHEVPQEAVAVPPVVGADALGAKPVADVIANGVAPLGREHAVAHVLDLVPAPPFVKTKDEVLVWPSRLEPGRGLARGRPK